MEHTQEHKPKVDLKRRAKLLIIRRKILMGYWLTLFLTTIGLSITAIVLDKKDFPFNSLMLIGSYLAVLCFFGAKLIEEDKTIPEFLKTGKVTKGTLETLNVSTWEMVQKIGSNIISMVVITALALKPFLPKEIAGSAYFNLIVILYFIWLIGGAFYGVMKRMKAGEL